MNVGFISLGCSKNLIDTEIAVGMFKDHHYNIVNDPAKAEIKVVDSFNDETPLYTENMTILTTSEV